MSRGAERHPLDALLRRHWRWLADPERDAVVLLRDDGLYLELGAHTLDSLGAQPPVGLEEVASALDDARGRGQHYLVVRTEAGVIVSASLAPTEPDEVRVDAGDEEIPW